MTTTGGVIGAVETADKIEDEFAGKAGGRIGVVGPLVGPWNPDAVGPLPGMVPAPFERGALDELVSFGYGPPDGGIGDTFGAAKPEVWAGV